MARIPESEDEYMQGTYVGLAKFRQGPDAAWKVDYLEGLQEPIKYLAFEDEHTLWAAHSYRGVYRIVLNENRDSLQTVRRFTGEELPNIYNVRLTVSRTRSSCRVTAIGFAMTPSWTG